MWFTNKKYYTLYKTITFVSSDIRQDELIIQSMWKREGDNNFKVVGYKFSRHIVNKYKEVNILLNGEYTGKDLSYFKKLFVDSSEGTDFVKLIQDGKSNGLNVSLIDKVKGI